VNVQLLECMPGIGLEAAEGVGEFEAQPRVDVGRDLGVDAAAGGGRLAVAGKPLQVAAATDDVGGGPARGSCRGGGSG
jgi:hypothetical protein